MKQILVFLVFLVIIISNVAMADMYDDDVMPIPEKFDDNAEICGKNEVWMVCSSCEQECGRSLKPCPKVCQPARCQCPAHKGYRRDADGKCVFCQDV